MGPSDIPSDRRSETPSGTPSEIPAEAPSETPPEIGPATPSGVLSGPVHVEFELTPEEWIDASLVHLSRSPIITQSVRMVQGLFVAIVLLLGLLQLLQGGPLLAAFLVGLGLLATPLIPALTRHSQKAQLRKVALRGIANGTFGPHRVELSEEGMRDITTGYEWLTRWESIERVEQSDDAFLIYTGPQAFLPVPVSAFPDAATLRAFSDDFYRYLERQAESVGADLSPSGEQPTLPAAEEGRSGEEPPEADPGEAR